MWILGLCPPVFWFAGSVAEPWFAFLTKCQMPLKVPGPGHTWRGAASGHFASRYGFNSYHFYFHFLYDVFDELV